MFPSTTTVTCAAAPGARLQLRGSPHALHHPLRVAVIGTRSPDAAACRWTQELVGDLAASRDGAACIVSGLARGIDGVAHTAALEAGGTTMGVLAHGLETVYPPEHADLAARILASGGALVSEHPDGTPPRPWRFVARDKLLATLAHVVVAVQSDVDGGTLHAVREALRRGIPICVPASPLDIGAGLAPLRARGIAVACADVAAVRGVLAAPARQGTLF